MKPGPKPSSTTSKKLSGSRRVNDAEPVHQPPPSSFDAVPSELADDAVAAKEWSRLVPMLMAARQIAEADRGVLVAVCLEWSRYIEATGKTRSMGLVIRAPVSGFPMQNPYLPIATRALVNLNRMWSELGLTPSSRSRVQVTPGPRADDAFGEFDVAIPLGPCRTKH